jgi:hypothetical protein
MKFYYLTFCLFLGSFIADAQDIITLNNAEEIPAKVEQIGIDDVIYKKFNNPTGPSYKILKSSIFMIKYENGTKEVFKKTEEPATTTYQTTPTPPAIPTLVAGRAGFRLDQEFYSYKETGELLKDPQYAIAYKTYKTARVQQKFSKPTIIVGMIAGIAGSVVTGVSLLLYMEEQANGNSYSYSSYSNTSRHEQNLKDYGTAAVIGGTTAVIGWSSFIYGFTLKSRAYKGFRKTAEQYNAVAKF